KVEGKELVFTISNEGVGHAFPTGDLFREVVLEVKFDGADQFRKIFRLGKTYVRQKRELRLTKDARLGPKEVRNVKVLVPANAKSARYRLMYYRSPESIREHSKLPKELWSKELVRGDLKLSASKK